MKRTITAILSLVLVMFLAGSAMAGGPPLGAALQKNTVTLAWPTNATGFELQYTTNPASTNWISVSNVPAIVNGQFAVTNATTNANAFYRLKSCGTDAPPAAAVIVNPGGDFEEQVSFGGSCPTDGCAAVNPLPATSPNTFDASRTVDPRRCGANDPAPGYHWEIFFPPTTDGGAQYSARGITGYHSPVLTIAENSLPDFPPGTADTFWRVRLTITHQPFDAYTTNSQATVVRFRFLYQGSALTLDMSSTCQNAQLHGQGCGISNALPPTETP